MGATKRTHPAGTQGPPLGDRCPQPKKIRFAPVSLQKICCDFRNVFVNYRPRPEDILRFFQKSMCSFPRNRVQKILKFSLNFTTLAPPLSQQRLRGPSILTVPRGSKTDFETWTFRTRSPLRFRDIGPQTCTHKYDRWVLKFAEVVTFLLCTDSFETRAAEWYYYRLQLATFWKSWDPPNSPRGRMNFWNLTAHIS